MVRVSVCSSIVQPCGNSVSSAMQLFGVIGKSFIAIGIVRIFATINQFKFTNISQDPIALLQSLFFFTLRKFAVSNSNSQRNERLAGILARGKFDIKATAKILAFCLLKARQRNPPDIVTHEFACSILAVVPDY
jgi:hypothetical protein